MRCGFIDIHQHLLYGVDDGARTLRDAQRMLAAACADGVCLVIATPHVAPGEKPIRTEAFAARLEKLRAFGASMGLSVRALLGAEVLYTPMTCRCLREGRVPTLGGTGYVLVEFLPDVRYDKLRAALRDILRSGYIPVVAHVERYACLRPHRALALKREMDDVLFQMNCSSVVGGNGFFADRHARRLLDEGLIDAVASDAHSLHRRPTRMREAFEALTERYDSIYASNLTGMSDASPLWRALREALRRPAEGASASGGSANGDAPCAR